MKTYKGTFNYQGYIWEGTTQAKNTRHAFSKLVVACAKHCNTTPYFMRNYFLHNQTKVEITCLN